MSARTYGMTEELHRYIVQETVQETDLQCRLRHETKERFDSDMQISPEQGQFFRFLVRALGVRRALEVGTFTGYSALAVATELPEDGHLDCCDMSLEFTAMAREFWSESGHGAKISLHIGPGRETLGRFLAEDRAGTYDFAFVDADKTGYPGYLKQCLLLLRPGGVVCFDNTIWSGAVADPSVMDADTIALRELNRLAATTEGTLSSLVPIGDGLTMVWKRS